MRFNEAKATQAAAHLLKARGGRMSYLKLIKLLYLADRESLSRFGHPITTDTYVGMKYGPVLSNVFDLITDEPDPAVGDSFWTAHISQPEHYEVSLTADPGDGLLSDAEDGLLQEIDAKYGHRGPFELVEIVHQFAEWIDPEGGARPITYADILRALNKPADQVRAILDELNAVTQFEKLFHPE